MSARTIAIPTGPFLLGEPAQLSAPVSLLIDCNRLQTASPEALRNRCVGGWEEILMAWSLGKTRNSPKNTAMSRREHRMPKGSGTYGGLLPKWTGRDAVLSMTEIKELPDTDASGLFPTPFLAVLDDQLHAYRKDAALRRALVAALGHAGSAGTDAITFVLSLAAFRIWRTSDDQRVSEHLLAATIKKCRRRARALRIKSFREEKALLRLRKLVQRQTVAKWQAYMTYGFALRHHPERPTPHVLEEFREVLTRHAFGRDPAQARKRQIGEAPLNSIRANVFRFRAADSERMIELSNSHFEALQRHLTQVRGLVPPHLRIGNW